MDPFERAILSHWTRTRSTRVYAFIYLKTEAETASETSWFIKKLYYGQSPKTKSLSLSHNAINRAIIPSTEPFRNELLFVLEYQCAQSCLSWQLPQERLPEVHRWRHWLTEERKLGRNDRHVGARRSWGWRVVLPGNNETHGGCRLHAQPCGSRVKSERRFCYNKLCGMFCVYKLLPDWCKFGDNESRILNAWIICCKNVLFLSRKFVLMYVCM